MRRMKILKLWLIIDDAEAMEGIESYEEIVQTDMPY